MTLMFFTYAFVNMGAVSGHPAGGQRHAATSSPTAAPRS